MNAKKPKDHMPKRKRNKVQVGILYVCCVVCMSSVLGKRVSQMSKYQMYYKK